jgi:hypothetical protein
LNAQADVLAPALKFTVSALLIHVFT